MRESAALLRHHLTVANGETLLFQRVGPLYPAAPATTALGGKVKRTDGSETELVQVDAEPASPVSFVPLASRVFVGTPAERVDWRGYPGALRLRVRFVSRPPATGEPLVVTGGTGAGDIIFVRHLENGRAMLGLDHWGVGETLSQPFEIAAGTEHELIISVGSLYPPDDTAACYVTEPRWRELRRRWVAVLDGRVLAMSLADFYPSQAEEIHVGLNAIGGSSAEKFFSGEIMEVGRARVTALPPP